jgi:hypothetical protein
MFKSRLEEAREKLHLGPDTLTGVSVLLLPENIDTSEVADLYDADDSVPLAKYFKSEGLACKTAYDLGIRPKIKDRRGIDIWLGVVWVLEYLAAPTITGVLSAWITTKYLQGSSPRSDQIGPSNGPPTIHLELRLQDGDRLSALKFDGSAADLVAVLQGLRQRNERLNDGRPQG